MNVVNIAPDGDVDFVVGTVKLRISSYILWGVSPVFRQMISNMYLEGARPSSTNPRSIFLPDNEKNMRILCMILHHQSDQVPEELDPRALLSFAKLLDKYKCASSAEIATRGWFRRALDKTSGIELIPLVEASWILDKADWFQDVTTKYVRTVDTKHEMPPWKQTTIMAVTTFSKHPCS